MNIWHGILIGVASTIFASFVCYNSGYDEGQKVIRYHDHVQATAGIFIDGYDKNKIYTIKLKELNWINGTDKPKE